MLRLIAGLLHPDKGHFVLDDETYVDTAQHFELPPQERPIGYVFQEYVLFPHLSVFDNVAFGLRMQGGYIQAGNPPARWRSFGAGAFSRI